MRVWIMKGLTIYERYHQDRTNQKLHYVAFFSAFIAWIFLLINWKWSIVFAILHYVLSWTGHNIYEKNEPGTYKRPFDGFFFGFLWFFKKSYKLVRRGRF